MWLPTATLGATDRATPKVASDEAGNAVVAWVRGAEVLVSRRRAGSEWTTPGAGAVSAATTPTGIPPAVTGDAAGNVLAAWADQGAAALRARVLDGASASGPDATHVYEAPGRRTVTVTLTDALGNTSTGARELIVEPRTAPPPPPGPGAAPNVVRFSLKPARLDLSTPRRKQRVRARIRLDAAGPVTLTFRTRKRKVVARLTSTLAAGSHTWVIRSKVGRTKLRPGRYTLTASAGGKARRATLRVVR